jgi:hypothetical protein
VDDPERYGVKVFADQDAVGEQDLVDLWVGEGALDLERARTRLPEVLHVACDRDGRPVGVSTAYLQHNAQLGMDLWYFRAFVVAAHRRSDLALTLALEGRDHLRERFVSGADVRAAGIVYEVQNGMLRRHFTEAVWPRTDFAFVGLTARGAPVRVHFFPGARAPGPPPPPPPPAPAQGST